MIKRTYITKKALKLSFFLTALTIACAGCPSAAFSAVEETHSKQPVQDFTTVAKEAILASNKDNLLGLIVENLTPESARNLGISANEKGVLISRVDQGSIASWAGLKKGILVIAVNHKKVTTVDEFNTALKETPANKPVLFLIKQGEAMRFVSLKAG